MSDKYDQFHLNTAENIDKNNTDTTNVVSQQSIKFHSQKLMIFGSEDIDKIKN